MSKSPPAGPAEYTSLVRSGDQLACRCWIAAFAVTRTGVAPAFAATQSWAWLSVNGGETVVASAREHDLAVRSPDHGAGALRARRAPLRAQRERPPSAHRGSLRVSTVAGRGGHAESGRNRLRDCAWQLVVSSHPTLPHVTSGSHRSWCARRHNACNADSRDPVCPQEPLAHAVPGSAATLRPYGRCAQFRPGSALASRARARDRPTARRAGTRCRDGHRHGRGGAGTPLGVRGRRARPERGDAGRGPSARERGPHARSEGQSGPWRGRAASVR